MNSVIDIGDAKFTNRFAVVHEKSRFLNFLEIGDEVIVHHNVFRMRRDVHGVLQESSNSVGDGIFSCFEDQMFAFRKPEGEWQSIGISCFIEPIKKTDVGYFHNDTQYEKSRGIVRINNPSLEARGIYEGDTVGFLLGSEYKFDIEGTTLYKMGFGRVICKF